MAANEAGMVRNETACCWFFCPGILTATVSNNRISHRYKVSDRAIHWILHATEVPEFAEVIGFQHQELGIAIASSQL